jgi:hypothetical protein
MDSMDSMDNTDTTEFEQPDPASRPGATGTPDQAGTFGRAKWSGRTKRVVTTVAASAFLLGSGAAIGVALPGGASASTGGTSTGGTTSAASGTAAAASVAAGRCAKLELRLRSHGHPVAANSLNVLCRNPLARLVLVGGAHGTATFETKTGPKTIAVERGTIQSASSSAITVLAKDGTTWTWDLTTSTAVREAGSVVTQDKLSTGEQVLVAGQVVSGVNDARLIRIAKAG